MNDTESFPMVAPQWVGFRIRRDTDQYYDLIGMLADESRPFGVDPVRESRGRVVTVWVRLGDAARVDMFID